MQKISLTPEQRSALESRHKKCRDRREGVRIKAVLLCDENCSVKIIDQVLRIHETDIIRHFIDHLCDVTYLPAYSPNLNPIKRLWKVMKKHAKNSQFFATSKELRWQLNYFFTTTLPAIADSLGSTINDNFQQYKPASWRCSGIYPLKECL